MQYSTIDDDFGTTPPRDTLLGHHRPRDISGPNFLVGHFLRNPGTDWQNRALEARMKRDATGGMSGEKLEILLKQEKSLEQQRFRDDYLTKAGPKALHGYVQILAKLGMKSVERDVKRRQEALRQMILADELRWQCMEDEKSSQEVSDRLSEMKQLTEKVRADQEAKRLEIVAEKREQQDRLRIDGLRELQAIRNSFNCKETNLCQMRDKKDRLEADKEIERLYCELGKKMSNSQIMRDEMDGRRKLARNNQQMDALRAQISYQQNQKQTLRNNQMILEAQRIRQLQEEECQRKEKEKIEKEAERQKMRRNFADQLAIRRRKIIEDADREAAEDERLSMENRALLLKESQAAEENKKSSMLEWKMFLSHVASMKEEQARQEELTDKLIEQDRIELQEVLDQRRCAEKAAGSKLLQHTLEERAKQIREKEEMKKWEEELQKEEQEEVERLRRCQKSLRADYEQRMLEKKQQYAQDLNNQLRFRCILKKREEEEKKDFWRRCEEEDKKYRERIEELLNKPTKVKVHPFLSKIEGRAQ